MRGDGGLDEDESARTRKGFAEMREAYCPRKGKHQDDFNTESTSSVAR